MIYRFVGAACQVGGLEFERFGQRAEFTPALARDVLEGGGAFVTEAQFEALGFTQDELTTFAYAGGFPEPTEAFAAKREAALALVRNGSVLAQTDEDGK